MVIETVEQLIIALMKKQSFSPVTVEQVLQNGHGICSGYVPGSVPGIYMEIHEYDGYIYIITCEADGSNKIYPLGLKWEAKP